MAGEALDRRVQVSHLVRRVQGMAIRFAAPHDRALLGTACVPAALHHHAGMPLGIFKAMFDQNANLCQNGQSCEMLMLTLQISNLTNSSRAGQLLIAH